jgi:hypothetical protein
MLLHEDHPCGMAEIDRILLKKSQRVARTARAKNSTSQIAPQTAREHRLRVKRPMKTGLERLSPTFSTVSAACRRSGICEVQVAYAVCMRQFAAEGVSKLRLTPLVQKVGCREGPTTARRRVGKGKVTPQNLQLLCFDTPSANYGRWPALSCGRSNVPSTQLTDRRA